MPANFRILQARDLGETANTLSAFALDVLVGLSAPQKRIPSKYFYDDQGSELFTEITRQPEYYLTGCEREIFENHRADIAKLAGTRPFNLVELGAGDGQKTSVLLEEFLRADLDFRYVPIDISEGAIRDLTAAIDTRFPKLDCDGLVSDYFLGLRWLAAQNDRRNFVLFLGSNIGNFDDAATRHFLVNLWNALNPDDLALIGFDLKKDIAALMAAYDDAAGITREFNLNLLRRINRELGGHFDMTSFSHFPNYDPITGRMQSFLVSLKDQAVPIDAFGKAFEFEAYEAIHLEFSHKYSLQAIARMAATTDFEIIAQYFDDARQFVDSVWRVRRQKIGG